jgi:hypothetical protein
MIKVTAKFIGKSSLGYLHGRVYVLIVDGYELTIQRTDGSGKCEYASMTAFLMNWDEIRQVA